MLGLLIDITRCVGCGACAAACAEQNGLPEPCGPELSDKQYTVLKKVHGRRGEFYYRRLCMHCLDPACASVCPVGALKKTPDGPVTYNAGVCMGCRYCVQACPFDAPRYEWGSLTPRLGKCSFCAERLASDRTTACAVVCPTGATTCGDRDALLKEARARLAAQPGRYVPRIYGEREVGGTSVLYLSPVPFSQLGLPENVPLHPLPALTFQALSQIPPLVGSAGILLAGLWWLTERKRRVTRREDDEGVRGGGR